MLVPVLDEARSIRGSVAAMLAQELDGEVEVLLADGGSEDGTRELLEALAREDPRVVVLDNPLRGTASGLNVCLGAARGRYVVRMDAHTTYPVRYAAEGIERLERGNVSWVAGPQVPEAGAGISGAVTAALGTWLGRGPSRKWSARDEVELDTGVFCGVWRREDVLRFGGWDEGFPRNQDSELAARFLLAGERIVSLPQMAARYQPRSSWRGLWRQYVEYGSYRTKTAVRHPTSLRRALLVPPGIVLTAVSATLGPRPLARPARLALAAYGLGLVRAAQQARSAGASVRDAARVPLALALMHAGHGTGFLLGCRRWGVPVRGLLRVAGIRRAEDERPYARPVDAPSLAAGRAARG